MRVNEDSYLIFHRAEELLRTHYNGWNIDDDTFKGTLEEESILTMIEDLCDEIEHLQEDNNYGVDYPEEERDREREVLGL